MGQLNPQDKRGCCLRLRSWCCRYPSSFGGASGDTPMDAPVEYKTRRRRKENYLTSTVRIMQFPTRNPTRSPLNPLLADDLPRLLNSKRIVGKSATEIAEVLGVASSSSPTTTPIDSPSGALTPISDDKITTSSTSVSDYFKEKMAKLRSNHKWMAESTSSSDLVTPPSLPSHNDDTNIGERPRTGIGARNALVHLAASTSAPDPSPSFPCCLGLPRPLTRLLPPKAHLPHLHRPKMTKTPGKKTCTRPKGGKRTRSRNQVRGGALRPPVVDGSMNAGVDDDSIVQIERRAVKKKRKAEANEGTIAIDMDADRERQHKNTRGKKRKARHDDS
ncbi:hypothetical protein BS47DRAFT_1197600 [Hydnum rufescens UP504]|uniref:Uncharacterized protein n=1 Tax=Hydnum rufescens UP504 TaxID=1448309 RepID=A0A9P6ATK6_9AGAM|nr:hypothetical protein BS47DRAFT_1197600 [Hydnum rufescens UP504]